MMVHGRMPSARHSLSSSGSNVTAKVQVNYMIADLLSRPYCLAQFGVNCKKLSSQSSIRGLRVCDAVLNPIINPCSGRLQFSGEWGNVRPFRTVSQAGRRHHRRREEPERKAPTRVSLDSKYRGDDKVEITLDFQELKQRAGKAAESTKSALSSSVSQAREKLLKHNSLNRQHTCTSDTSCHFKWPLLPILSTAELFSGKASKTFIKDGKQAWREIQSSVAVQNDKRVVIAVKRSTIDFAGRTILWSILTVVFVRVVLACARRFRWGWEEGINWPKYVRDRSLGGKEVVASKGIKLWESGPAKKAFIKTSRGLSPLDSVRATSRSEKELHRLRNDTESSKAKVVQRTSQLPVWWPTSDQAPSLPPQASERVQRDARMLLNEMLEKRISGVDFGEHDICKLRQLCRDSGAKVSFDTTNTRDSFYRAAIQVVMSSCSSGLPLGIVNENPQKFVSGLAVNIGINAEKAATMVIAAVAARTRAGFLQAWARHMQGDAAARVAELQQLVRIHSAFIPNPNSPEMELVGTSLAYFGIEERRELLNMYVDAGGSKTESIAREALGLPIPTRNRSAS